MKSTTTTSIEIEKKFLIKMPDIQQLVGRYNPKINIIEQIYLTAKSGERRIRSCIAPYGDGDYMYRFWYTEKTPADTTGFKRLEKERQIDFHEYHQLVEEADPELKKISKTRYNFYIEGQLYELDVFPFNKKFAILEIELDSEDANFAWPEILVKVADVTEDKNFKNKALAKNLAFPEIR